MTSRNPTVNETNKATRFSKSNQPKNAGRKKNKFTYLKDQYDLSATDVSNIIKYIASMTPDDLKELIESKTTPVIILAYASAAYHAIKDGNLGQIETMLNRVIGKPTDKIEQTNKEIKEYKVEITSNEAMAEIAQILIENGAIDEGKTEH